VRVTRVAIHIAAPPSAVYAALVSPEAVQRWMVPDDMTSEIHSFDAVEGGTFRISLTYDDVDGVGKTAARTDTQRGRFVRLVEDAEVVQAVSFETDDPALQGEMTIRYVLAPTDGGRGTRLEAVHESVPPDVDLADNELGWTMSLRKLAALVA
jgi:uncharacterized protein YndB with AHSA1/START domain